MTDNDNDNGKKENGLLLETATPHPNPLPQGAMERHDNNNGNGISVSGLPRGDKAPTRNDRPLQRPRQRQRQKGKRIIVRNSDPSPCFASRNHPLPQGAREGFAINDNDNNNCILVSGLPRGDKAPLAMTAKGYGYDKGNGIVENGILNTLSAELTPLFSKRGITATTLRMGLRIKSAMTNGTAKSLSVTGLPRGDKAPLAMTTLRETTRQRQSGKRQWH
jgi:hypothetical protein